MFYLDEIKEFASACEQEENDKRIMLEWISRFPDTVLYRKCELAHLTSSSQILNESRDKVLMVYHNIYQSWSWTGGHADGEADLLAVALREAQEKGYAERDPSADVDGHDACRKICILAAIAFGRHIYPDQVPTEGIRGVSLADVDYAESAGKKIKLLGRAVRLDDGRVCAYVAPHLVDQSDPLSGVEDVFNAISVRGDAIGDVMFYGRGAGKLPTASAVVADVMDVARNLGHRKALVWDEGGEDAAGGVEEFRSRWYVRAAASADELKNALGGKLPAGRGTGDGECACVTDESMTRGELDKKLAGLVPLSVFRVLD